MNSTKSPTYLNRPQKSRLYTAPDETFSYDLKPSSKKINQPPPINLKKPVHKAEYGGFPLKSNSVQTPLSYPEQAEDIYNNENVQMKSTQDDHLYYLREEDDEGLDETPSPTDKGKDKYLKRRQKNEKNYKDLNKSLANLALKRVINRSSSSDTNSWLSGQLQAHAEKSHNFEFQPYFLTPTLQIKNSLATTNHSNAGIGGSNSSYGSLAKTYLNSPLQISPQRTITRSHHSPARPTSPFQPSIYRLEQESKMKGGSRDCSQGPVSSANSIYSDLKIEDIARKNKNKSEKSWLDSNVKFFPGNLEKINSSEPHREIRHKAPTRLNRGQGSNLKASNLISFHHERSTDSIETALSYKDVKGMKDKSNNVLDSRLPSKIDLHEKSSPKNETESQGFRGTAKAQEEQSFEPIEKKTLDGWKTEILKIKSDMENRKKHYNEVNQFFAFCEGTDKRQRSVKKSRGLVSSKSPTEGHNRNISIFSGSTLSKTDAYDSKSGNILIMSPLNSASKAKTQKPQKKTGKVSFDLALDEERPTAKLQGPHTRPNQGFENSQARSYYGFNQRMYEENTQSFADPCVKPRSKSPLYQNNGQEQSCNIF